MIRPKGAPFQAGRSGNPGGRPKTAEISALARRYTADALCGLVKVARLPPDKHDTAVRAACDSLIDLGYPGARRAGPGDGDAVNVLHMHLLAVQGAATGAGMALPVQLPTLVSPPATDALPPWDVDPDPLPDGPPLPESPDAPGGLPPESLIDGGYLPEPGSELPAEALPLWDAARKPETDRDAARKPPGFTDED